MNETKAIYTLYDVVKSCAYLMPSEWRESHLADAQEAVKSLAKLTHKQDVEWARDYFKGELKSWEIGIKNGTVCEDAPKYAAAYRLALEGLDELEKH